MVGTCEENGCIEGSTYGRIHAKINGRMNGWTVINNLLPILYLRAVFFSDVRIFNGHCPLSKAEIWFIIIYCPHESK
jgi:hypothetical protein